MRNYPPRSLRLTSYLCSLTAFPREANFSSNAPSEKHRLHKTPPTSPTTDAAHAIFFSQTRDVLRDESPVNIVRIDPEGEVGPRW